MVQSSLFLVVRSVSLFMIVAFGHISRRTTLFREPWFRVQYIFGRLFEAAFIAGKKKWSLVLIVSFGPVVSSRGGSGTRSNNIQGPLTIYAS